jgi:hypothetical protein
MRRSRAHLGLLLRDALQSNPLPILVKRPNDQPAFVSATLSSMQNIPRELHSHTFFDINSLLS